MDTLSFKMDIAKLPDHAARCALLTVAFRDGTVDAVVLTEEQVQRVAITATLAVRSGDVASLGSLEFKGGPERKEEFLRRRETLNAVTSSPRGLIASDIRPFAHGGGIVLPVAKTTGFLFGSDSFPLLFCGDLAWFS